MNKEKVEINMEINIIQILIIIVNKNTVMKINIKKHMEIKLNKIKINLIIMLK